LTRILSKLRFPPEEMREPLERISKGQGTVEDLVSLGEQMETTAGEVRLVIWRLKNEFPEYIRGSYGLEILTRIEEEVIKIKNDIRRGIGEIVAMETDDPERNDRADDVL